MDNIQLMSLPVYETSESNSPDISYHHHDRSPVSVLLHSIDDLAITRVHDHCVVEKAAATHDRQKRNQASVSIVRKEGIAMASEHRHSRLYLHNQPSPSPCAAVPFRWEESPGKPRITNATNNTAIASPSEGDSVSVLKLPPKLQSMQARHSISDKLDLRSQNIYRETAPRGSSTMQTQKGILRLCKSMFTASQQHHNPDTTTSITAHGRAHSNGARTVDDTNSYHRFFFDKRSSSALINDILLSDEGREEEELLKNRSEWMEMEEKIAIIERGYEEERLDERHSTSGTWQSRRRARAGAEEERGKLVSKVWSWQEDEDEDEDSSLGAGGGGGLPWLQLRLDSSSFSCSSSSSSSRPPPPSPSYHEISQPSSIHHHHNSSSSSSPSLFSPFPTTQLHLAPSSHTSHHLANGYGCHLPPPPLLHSTPPSPFILGLIPELPRSYEPLFWSKFHGRNGNRTAVIASFLTITSLKNILRKLLAKKSTRSNFIQAHDNMWSPALATYLFNQQQRESELSPSNLGLNLTLPSEEVVLEHSSSSNYHGNSKCHSNPKQDAHDTFISRKSLLTFPPLKSETTTLNIDHVHAKICMEDHAKNDNRQRIRLKFHEHLAWKDMKKDLAARDVVIMAQ